MAGSVKGWGAIKLQNSIDVLTHGLPELAVYQSSAALNQLAIKGGCQVHALGNVRRQGFMKAAFETYRYGTKIKRVDIHRHFGCFQILESGSRPAIDFMG